MRFIEQDLRGGFHGDRFVNQFVLGPEFPGILTGWQHLDLGPSLKLGVHPGLSIQHVGDTRKSITIIGYILDPERPEATDRDIAEFLLGEFSELDQLIQATGRFGGRWVIVARCAEQATLFSDALGLRQVFFTRPDFSRGVWAASQPGILAWLFNLNLDDAAMKFLDSYVIRKYREYRWPGNATAFSEITHLLPNHCLDPCTGHARRFWPKAPIGKLSLDQGVSNAIGILNGLMDAAYRRFDLVHGVTAGFDSRVVLAASRKHRDRIRAITVRQGQMPDDHADLTVPASMLGALKIHHRIIKALPYMSADFSKAFKENVFLAHDHYGPDAEAIREAYSREKVAVTGGGAEVARASFRNRIDAGRSRYTAEEFARLLHMDDEFAVRAYAQWLDGTGDLFDVHVLDLLSWENLHGNWLAGTQLEFDFAWRDIFTPFNCRKLLVQLLSIDEMYRSAPDYTAFRLLIERMWPELLVEPINPQKRLPDRPLRKVLWQRSKKRLKRYLARLGLR